MTVHGVPAASRAARDVPSGTSSCSAESDAWSCVLSRVLLHVGEGTAVPPADVKVPSGSLRRMLSVRHRSDMLCLRTHLWSPAMADPSSRDAYKPTLFDRHGPDAANLIRAVGFGLMVFGLTAGAIISQGGLSFATIVFALVAGTVAGGSGLALGVGAGWAWKRLTVDGRSTPYQENYSYQQTLVMQGRLAEALESFEAVIAERPDAIDARLRAAELYAREGGRPDRAADLFREAQRLPALSAGNDIYIANRLVDLYAGPLAAPGRAMVELRRLIDRYPASPAATAAREALVRLKATQDA